MHYHAERGNDHNRPPSQTLPIDEKIIQAQQATADLFYQNRLLPNAVWR